MATSCGDGRYLVSRRLGSGSFGTVFAAQPIRSDSSGMLTPVERDVAIKRIARNGTNVSRELQILRKLSGARGCVELLDAFHTVDEEQQIWLNLVFPYFPTTLYSTVERNELSFEQKRGVFAQVTEGLAYLHSMHIAHRDLTPANILIDMKYGDRASHCAVITDYGCSKLLQETHAPHIHSYVTTEPFRAPEIVLGSSKTTVAVDIWGLACVLWAALFRNRDLFGVNLTELLDARSQRLAHFERMIFIRGTPRPEQFEGLSPLRNRRLSQLSFVEPVNLNAILPTVYRAAGLSNLLSNMLEYSPQQRWTIQQVRQHAFVRQARFA